MLNRLYAHTGRRAIAHSLPDTAAANDDSPEARTLVPGRAVKALLWLVAAVVIAVGVGLFLWPLLGLVRY